jgi:hypothetical protein
MARCEGKTIKGDQCKNNAIKGKLFCYLAAHGGGNAKSLPRSINWIGNRIKDLSIFGLILALIAMWWAYIDSKKTAESGILKPSLNSNPVIALGGAQLIIKRPDHVFICDGKQPLLSIKQENGRLFVSAEIRNPQGQLIAEVHDNEWKINKAEIFDRNYNENAFEVRGKDGDVIFQAVAVNNVIYISGEFRGRNGKGLLLLKEPNGQGGLIDILGPNEKRRFEIAPLFEYPSDLHFGVCTGFFNVQLISMDTGHGYVLTNFVFDVDEIPDTFKHN